MKQYPSYIIPALLVGFADIFWASFIIWLFVAFDTGFELLERVLLGLALYAAFSVLYAGYLLAVLAAKARVGKLNLSMPRTMRDKYALVSDLSLI